MGAGQQKGVLEDDGVGRNGVGKTSLVLVRESPENDEEQQPRDEEVVVVNRDEIVRCVVAAEQVHDVADQVVKRDDDRQEGDEQKRHVTHFPEVEMFNMRLAHVMKHIRARSRGEDCPSSSIR